MRDRLLPLARRYGLDAIVVGLAIAGVIESALHPVTWEGHDKGPEWLVRPLTLALTLPILLRHVLPFAAPAAVLVSASAAAFVSGEAVVGTSANFGALMVASLAIALNERRVALVGLGLVIAMVALVNVNLQSFVWGDFLFPAAVFTVTWFLGHLWHEREERLRAATERLARAQAEQGRAAEAAALAERERIARELHDVIAHSVSVMTVQAGAVRRRLGSEQERERDALLAVEETGRKALDEMRRLLGVLRRDEDEAELEPQPGLGALDQLVAQVREAGLPVDLSYEGERVDLPAGVDLSAYRIVQEALTNALKHAGPAHAWVSVRYGGDDVEVEIANDGRSEANGDGEGQGLVGMRERVALCGGELRAGPRDGGGFRISARLPVAGSRP